MTLLFDRFDSPIGVLTIAGDERGLSHVLFPENRHPARGRDDWHYAPGALPVAREQLLQFLHGERNSFDLVLALDIALDHLGLAEQANRVHVGT